MPSNDEDRRFMAENDFRALKEAAEIIEDKKRLDRALKAGEDMIEDSKDAVQMAKKTAGLRRA